VLFAEVSGEPENRIWLSAVTARSGQPESYPAVLVAESEHLYFMDVHDRWIRIQLLEHGPDDAECCPAQLWTKEWAIVEGKLQQVSSTMTGELSIEMLPGYTWLLTRLDGSTPAPEEPEINILFKTDKVKNQNMMKGKGGCTPYFGELAEASPGVIEFGSIGMINRSCRPELMQLESSYLARLRAVKHYGFRRGNLALIWETDEGYDQLSYVRRPWPENQEKP
jgi:heat shock protein HslJ